MSAPQASPHATARARAGKPHVEELDARAIADDVRAGRRSAADVLEHQLERIALLDPGLGAFVFLDVDGAREAAAKVDETVALGVDPGPLAGLPVGVKELEEVAGWPHTFACTLFADRVAGFTSTQVSRARAAGAVPLGLTASPEFGATSFTASTLHGVTRNPWNLDRTPGGSSGGSAAAVAAGLVPLATGSDSAGSLRIPASFSGVVGFKGTYGRVPRGPGYVGSPNFRNYGALTRSVRDAARFLDCVVGPDERDPLSLPHPGLSYELAIDGVELAGTRVAWTVDLGFGVCDADVTATTRTAAATLIREAAFDELDLEVALPDPAAAWEVLGLPDLYAGLRSFFPERAEEVPPGLRRGFESATEISVEDLCRGHAARQALVQALADLFDRVDLLLLPTTPTAAFAAEGPMPAEIAGRPVDPLLTVALTYPFSLSGHPAVSVPAGWVDSAPIGLQIVGRRHEDLLVLAAAAALERVLPWPLVAPMPPSDHGAERK